MNVDLSIFREYDIRGVWGKTIDKNFSIGLGLAFAEYLKQKVKKENLTISIGYDARLSSKDIFSSLCIGLNYAGVSVIDIGLVPTPVQYFSLFKLEVDGGIMITASHNPKEYNGFKLSVGKETIFSSQIQDVGNIMKHIEIPNDIPLKANRVSKYDMVKDYENYMLKQFGYLKTYKNKPKLVLDAGNGSGGFVGISIMQKLGFEVKGLFIEPDGNFPNHHPDPTVLENLSSMKKEMETGKYEVGIGYDGDADRIGVVLKNSDMLYGDQILLLFAQDLIKQHKSAKIIGEVKCSQVLFDGIKKAGGIPIMYKAGHSLIKDKMKKENALLAGEMSGHIFFADRYFGYDDAIYVSLRLLEILSKEKIDLIKWKNSLPTTFNTPEIRVDCQDDKKETVINNLKQYFSTKKQELQIVDINDIDGIRFKTKSGWGLVRASNTQPALVLRFEDETNEGLDKLKNLTMKITKDAIKNA